MAARVPLNSWMDYERRRIRRESPAYSAHASESWPANAAPPTEEEWQKTIPLPRSYLLKLARLADSPPGVLAEEVVATHPDNTKRSSSLLAVLWQTLVHNSYHIGQLLCCAAFSALGHPKVAATPGDF